MSKYMNNKYQKNYRKRKKEEISRNGEFKKIPMSDAERQRARRERLKKIREEKNNVQKTEEPESSREAHISKPASSTSSKKKKRKKSTCIEEFMESCKKALDKSNDVVEYDAVGISVAKKLQRMDPAQAIYAESLITEVLKRGLLNKLSEDTSINDKRLLFVPTENFTSHSVVKPESSQAAGELLRYEEENQNFFKRTPGPSWESV